VGAAALAPGRAWAATHPSKARTGVKPTPVQAASGAAAIAAGKALAALHPRAVSAAHGGAIRSGGLVRRSAPPSGTQGQAFGGHTPEPIPKSKSATISKTVPVKAKPPVKASPPKGASKPPRAIAKPAHPAHPTKVKPIANAGGKSGPKPAHSGGGGGSNAEIADATRALYRANKKTIGANRNFLHVGATIRVGGEPYKIKRGDSLWKIASRHGGPAKKKAAKKVATA
jgi:LysM repeat protein